MITTGQITPDSPFGKALTKYARAARTILEIGFGSGLGSTQCLIAGMSPGAHLTAIEADREQFKFGSQNIKQQGAGRVVTLLGVLHRTIRPYWHPINGIQHRECWKHERMLIWGAPMIEPPKDDVEFDLLVLDGGEFTSDGDFLMLWETAKVIALDDLNPSLATKNVYAAECLRKAGWHLLRDGINDRNGWQIWGGP